MFKLNGKYGSIHVNGMSIDIDRIDITKLDKYLGNLERRRLQIIEQQNEYLSQLIKGVKRWRERK